MSGGPDWSDGDYSLTAAELEPVARLVVEHAGITAGQQVLDVGCGTGNAALAAAQRGARVTAVDPAAGLREIAARRTSGMDVRVLDGDAQRLPDGRFDAVLSVFAAIFDPDPAAAARAMVGSMAPGGRLVMTSWQAWGAIHRVGDLLVKALELTRDAEAAWHEPAWVADLLTGAGAGRVDISEHRLVFRDDSPRAWLARTEEHHPFWRWARRRLPEDRWRAVHEESLAILEAGNDDPQGFATTSGYLMITASTG